MEEGPAINSPNLNRLVTALTFLLALLEGIFHTLIELVDIILSPTSFTLDTTNLVSNPVGSILDHVPNIIRDILDVLHSIVKALFSRTAYVLGDVLDLLLIAADVLLGTVVLSLCL